MRGHRPKYRLEQGGRIVVRRVWVADSFGRRALGLMFRRSLPLDTALYLPGCRAVHTFGMRFNLDIRFLDRDGYMVRAVTRLKPWRLAWGGWRAVAALESAPGCLNDRTLDPGKPLRLVREMSRGGLRPQPKYVGM